MCRVQRDQGVAIINGAGRQRAQGKDKPGNALEQIQWDSPQDVLGAGDALNSPPVGQSNDDTKCANVAI
eukprot:CAMPEP_0170442484 /NCGR_PEP_ID=MMETSP0117_2-20130122/47443_1 /TAXON_ID=400756 /ORGANISM="Durinskia baltica, Strain CSIRO CS-38" /LENGTH=68 /DNA_ID=CAMNT_0010703077 /DNA_START=260 /DNA_END=466 /DNA_ORIENTATION=+